MLFRSGPHSDDDESHGRPEAKRRADELVEGSDDEYPSTRGFMENPANFKAKKRSLITRRELNLAHQVHPQFAGDSEFENPKPQPETDTGDIPEVAIPAVNPIAERLAAGEHVPGISEAMKQVLLARRQEVLRSQKAILAAQKSIQLAQTAREVGKGSFLEKEKQLARDILRGQRAIERESVFVKRHHLLDMIDAGLPTPAYPMNNISNPNGFPSDKTLSYSAWTAAEPGRTTILDAPMKSRFRGGSYRDFLLQQNTRAQEARPGSQLERAKTVRNMMMHYEALLKNHRTEAEAFRNGFMNERDILAFPQHYADWNEITEENLVISREYGEQVNARINDLRNHLQLYGLPIPNWLRPYYLELGELDAPADQYRNGRRSRHADVFDPDHIAFNLDEQSISRLRAQVEANIRDIQGRNNSMAEENENVNNRIRDLIAQYINAHRMLGEPLRRAAVFNSETAEAANTLPEDRKSTRLNSSHT